MWNEENQQFCIEKDSFCCSVGGYFINRGWAPLNWDCTKIVLLKQQDKRKVLGEEQTEKIPLNSGRRTENLKGIWKKTKNNVSAFQIWFLCHYVPYIGKKGMHL